MDLDSKASGYARLGCSGNFTSAIEPNSLIHSLSVVYPEKYFSKKI